MGTEYLDEIGHFAADPPRGACSIAPMVVGAAEGMTLTRVANELDVLPSQQLPAHPA